MNDLSEFRFFVLCETATWRKGDDAIDLRGVINRYRLQKAGSVSLVAVVGLILRPEMEGKRLDLIAWQLDRRLERTRIDAYVGVPLILPAQKGPAVLPHELTLPIHARGLYGCDLFDRDGTFAAPETLLATYLFSVESDH